MRSPRPSHREHAPELVKALAATRPPLEASTLGRALIDLVDVRVSQINGCAFCLDIHTRELLASDGDMPRLNALAAWRDADLYTPRERAALQWAESLTRVEQSRPSDADFDALRAHFNDREIVELTIAVAVMNAWNRVGIGLRLPVPKR